MLCCGCGCSWLHVWRGDSNFGLRPGFGELLDFRVSGSGALTGFMYRVFHNSGGATIKRPLSDAAWALLPEPEGWVQHGYLALQIPSL